MRPSVPSPVLCPSSVHHLSVPSCPVVAVVVICPSACPVVSPRRRPLQVRPLHRPSRRRRRPSSVRSSPPDPSSSSSSSVLGPSVPVRPVVVVSLLSVLPAVGRVITYMTSRSIRRVRTFHPQTKRSFKGLLLNNEGGAVYTPPPPPLFPRNANSQMISGC